MGMDGCHTSWKDVVSEYILFVKRGPGTLYRNQLANER